MLWGFALRGVDVKVLGFRLQGPGFRAAARLLVRSLPPHSSEILISQRNQQDWIPDAVATGPLKGAPQEGNGGSIAEEP